MLNLFWAELALLDPSQHRFRIGPKLDPEMVHEMHLPRKVDLRVQRHLGESRTAMNKRPARIVADPTEYGGTDAGRSDDRVGISAEWLQPSSRGARLTISHGKRTVVDGPFTESKELIGGFAMIQADSKEGAIAWAFRFATVLSNAGAVGDIEIDVRPLA